MAKKKKKSQVNRGKSPVIWVVIGIVAVIAILAISGKIPMGSKEKGKSFQITEKETRPVLDPSLFTGMTRSAYAAAQRYPDALNEAFCYCYCNEPPFNHKSLLSCFTDRHGAG
jgi:hypothetical protein